MNTLIKSTLIVAFGMALLTLLFMSSVFAQVSPSLPGGGTTAAEQSAIAASTAHAGSTTAVHGIAAGVSVVGASGAQTLYNKTIDGNTTIYNGSTTQNFSASNLSVTTVNAATPVDATGAQTLYNKTLDTNTTVFNGSTTQNFSAATVTATVVSGGVLTAPSAFYSAPISWVSYSTGGPTGFAYFPLGNVAMTVEINAIQILTGSNTNAFRKVWTVRKYGGALEIILVTDVESGPGALKGLVDMVASGTSAVIRLSSAGGTSMGIYGDIMVHGQGAQKPIIGVAP